MSKVTILDTTTKRPITTIGERAGICWNTDISDEERNYCRGLQILRDGHGRPLEFVSIEMILDGYSARTIREWYTHVGGSPTRLQESTRYLDLSKGFEYITPYGIYGEAEDIYSSTMKVIMTSYKELASMGVSKEDAAMILPLGMCTKIVDKRNLRNFIDICHQRLCSRAYWEFQDLVMDIVIALRKYDDEWDAVADEFFVPKCEYLGYCPEHDGCGHISHINNPEEDDYEA